MSIGWLNDNGRRTSVKHSRDINVVFPSGGVIDRPSMFGGVISCEDILRIEVW